jgi:transcriptional regulator with XRE-family HTH domain
VLSFALSGRPVGVYANFSLQELGVGATLRVVPSFGENVRRLRLAVGIKRSKDLAAILQVAPSIVSRWETDKTGLPETPTLFRLAKALRCSIDQLLAGVDAEYDAIIGPPQTRAASAEQVEAQEVAALWPHVSAPFRPTLKILLHLHDTRVAQPSRQPAAARSATHEAAGTSASPVPRQGRRR